MTVLKHKQNKSNKRLNTNGLENLFSVNENQLPTDSSISTNQKQNLLRSEKHMFLWPYFVLDKKADRSKIIETTEVVKVGNKRVERKWQVQPHPDYGLPGPMDSNVLIALYSIACEDYVLKGLKVPDKMPIGNWKKFVERIGLPKSGRINSLVKMSLKRLVRTTCHSENTFFDKTTNMFVVESFSVLKSAGLKGEEVDGEEIIESYVSFNQRILDNLNVGYLQILDKNLYSQLKTDIAKHLYPLLSYWFYRNKPRNYWRAQYKWLANRLGIKEQKELWRAKDRLKKAHEELLKRGYIADYKWDGWTIIYTAGPAFEGEQLRRKIQKPSQSIQPKQLSLELDIEQDSLTPALSNWAVGVYFADRELKKHGLTPKQAEALCIERGIKITRSSI